MTKAADKIVDLADVGIDKIMFRAGRHFTKMKHIAKKPIEKGGNGRQRAARVTKKIAGVGGKVVADVVDISAALTLKLSELFVVGFDRFLFDNRILDATQRKYKTQSIAKNKKGNDKVISKFTKKNPRLAAYLTWYLMLTAVIGGAGVGVNKDKISDNIKSKFENARKTFAKANADENETGEKTVKNEEQTFDVQKLYSPESESFAKDFVDENWNEIVAGLLEFETYRDKPTVHAKETRATYGPGLTWVYQNGVQYPCQGKYKQVAENFSDVEVWNQVKQHCLYRGECLHKLRNELNKYNFSFMTDNQVLGLFFAGYQTPSLLADKKVNKGKPNEKIMPGIVHRLSEAGDDTQKIVDSFVAGTEINSRWRNGTNKRRWWCAMYYIGKISADDFLALDRDVFSEIDINVIMKNGHFVYDDDVIDYALNLKNVKKSKNGTVKDFIVLRLSPDNPDEMIKNSSKNTMLAFNKASEHMKSKMKNSNRKQNVTSDEYQA